MSVNSADALVQRLIRPNIAALVPYRSARDEAPDALDTPKRQEASIGLDANETWAPLVSSSELMALNRYPHPQPVALRKRLAELWQAPSLDEVFLGRGADDGIDALMRAFCRPSVDAIAYCPPTYGMYGVSAAIQNIECVPIPLQALEGRFVLDSAEVLARFPHNGKLLFLCSPNNPTGNSMDYTAIERILEGLQHRALVIVDEAYLEYSENRSLAQKLKSWPNMVILRTLSKAWGLAGARVGGVVARPEVIEVLNRVRAPYPLSSLSIDAALAMVCAENSEAIMKERVRETLEARRVLCDGLLRLPTVEKVFPSDANFLLVRFVENAAFVAFRAARHAGIRLRDRTQEPGCSGCLRITVGNTEQNARLLNVLNKMSKG